MASRINGQGVKAHPQPEVKDQTNSPLGSRKIAGTRPPTVKAQEEGGAKPQPVGGNTASRTGGITARFLQAMQSTNNVPVVKTEVQAGGTVGQRSQSYQSKTDIHTRQAPIVKAEVVKGDIASTTDEYQQKQNVHTKNIPTITIKAEGNATAFEVTLARAEDMKGWRDAYASPPDKQKLHEKLDLSRQQKTGFQFENSKYVDLDARNSKLHRTNWQGAEFDGAKFSSDKKTPDQHGDAGQDIADLQETNFASAKGRNVDFSGSNLHSSIFRGAELRDAKFVGTNLTNNRFEWSKLPDADFSNAKLNNATFGHADLQGAKFHGADLAGADFEGAQNLVPANFKGAQNLSQAKNLPPGFADAVEREETKPMGEPPATAQARGASVTALLKNDTWKPLSEATMKTIYSGE